MRNLHPEREREKERILSERERERESHANRCQITRIFLHFYASAHFVIVAGAGAVGTAGGGRYCCIVAACN